MPDNTFDRGRPALCSKFLIGALNAFMGASDFMAGDNYSMETFY